MTAKLYKIRFRCPKMTIRPTILNTPQSECRPYML